ncbi:hypothetical protein A0H76_2742 [Hepatospora eriocheir]|uniref:Uncharacterized protein n=1 Tax=Hepatospora eriocheir TaxID=1081669 RepID=A0A1X0QF80_9MICR|nr:hypothetical protein A0H76_2742 [Hepatospora eriocheir]
MNKKIREKLFKNYFAVSRFINTSKHFLVEIIIIIMCNFIKTKINKIFIRVSFTASILII